MQLLQCVISTHRILAEHPAAGTGTYKDLKSLKLILPIFCNKFCSVSRAQVSMNVNKLGSNLYYFACFPYFGYDSSPIL